MKILFCTNSIGTRGGIERVTIVKANALAEMSDEEGQKVNRVAIAFSDRFRFPETIHPLSPLVETFDTEADIWHDWNYKGFGKITEPIRKLIKYYKALQRIVDSFAPDVIVGVGQSEKFIIPLLRSKKPLLKIREVHFNSTYRRFTYGDDWKSKIKVRIAEFLDFRINCQMYDKVFLLTKQDKDENFASNDKFSWMWNPSSFVSEVYSIPMDKREHIICSAGRLHEIKDFPAQLRAWFLLGENRGDWKLRIIGEGYDEERLRKMTSDLGISDSVEFPGHSQNMKEELKRASVFVFTSRYEGFGLVIAEAMSCGLPVVSFETKYGSRDIIRDHVDGFIVDNRDEKVLAERMYALMQDISLRQTMSNNALERAKCFDPEVIAKAWMKEYQMLLEVKQKK